MNAYISLINFLNNTSPSDIYYKVAQNILQNLDKIRNASIHEIAELCYVSAPTISRFCKKMGYPSYSAFKTELSQAVSNYNYNNRYVSIDPSIHSEDDGESLSFLYQIGHYAENLKNSFTKSYIREIAESLHEHHRIGFFTCAPSYQLQYLQADLLITRHDVTYSPSPQDQMEFAKTLDEDSIGLVVRPERLEASFLDEIIAVMKERHVKVILISNTKNTKVAKLADYQLCFIGNLHIVDSFCFDMLISLLSIEYRKMYLSS